jgi:hypothetical protein
LYGRQIATTPARIANNVKITVMRIGGCPVGFAQASVA